MLLLALVACDPEDGGALWREQDPVLTVDECGFDHGQALEEPRFWLSSTSATVEAVFYRAGLDWLRFHCQRTGQHFDCDPVDRVQAADDGSPEHRTFTYAGDFDDLDPDALAFVQGVEVEDGCYSEIAGSAVRR